MRAVRLSITFNDQLNELLDWGEQRFGIAVAEQKKSIVYTTIEQFLARYPKTKRRDPAHGLCVYPISKTPFVVLYDSMTASFACISSSTAAPICANSIQ